MKTKRMQIPFFSRKSHSFPLFLLDGTNSWIDPNQAAAVAAAAASASSSSGNQHGGGGNHNSSTAAAAGQGGGESPYPPEYGLGRYCEISNVKSLQSIYF